MKSQSFATETVGGLKLRPWTLSTRKSIMALIPEFKEDEDSIQRQIVTIAWIQSQEPEDVEQMIRDGSAEKKITEFENRFPLAAFPSVAAWAAKQAEAVQSAVVTVVPKPSSGSKGEQAPPN
jgi:hypothetical protein